jgi:hypothetical protein
MSYLDIKDQLTTTVEQLVAVAVLAERERINKILEQGIKVTSSFLNEKDIHPARKFKYQTIVDTLQFSIQEINKSS